MPRMGPRPSEDSSLSRERLVLRSQVDVGPSGASNLQAPRVAPRGVTRVHDPRSAWLGTSSFLASAIPRPGPRALLPPGAPLPKAWAHWAFSQISPIITCPPTLLAERQGK